MQLKNNFKTTKNGKLKIPVPSAVYITRGITSQVPKDVIKASLPINYWGISTSHCFRDD